MGVAYAQGLSKNSSWSDPDAVIPVMKVNSHTHSLCSVLIVSFYCLQHFAAHGSPQGGVNAAPYTGYGMRQVVSEMLVPFKAVVELGGARGVMMYVSQSPLIRVGLIFAQGLSRYRRST